LGKSLIVAYISIFIFDLLLGRMSKEDAALKKQFERKWDDLGETSKTEFHTPSFLVFTRIENKLDRLV
jgi:hypothetical protein